MKLGLVGKWAFILGLVIAVIAGIFFQAAWVVWVLALLGVVVGLLNITAEETERFLLAAIAFLLSATALGVIPFIGGVLTNILAYVAAFVAGATVVVALIALFRTAR
jgi:ATP synthase protein I